MPSFCVAARGVCGGGLGVGGWWTPPPSPEAPIGKELSLEGRIPVGFESRLEFPLELPSLQTQYLEVPAAAPSISAGFDTSHRSWKTISLKAWKLRCVLRVANVQTRTMTDANDE